MCLFSHETENIPLLTIDRREHMKDDSGKPILIKGLTPILTEYIKLSKGLGIGASKKCSDEPMVRICIYNGNIYEG